MYHRSPSEIMSQPPGDQQAYDPQYNFAVDRPLRGTHAYAQNSSGYAPSSYTPLPTTAQYQLRHGSGLEHNPHNASMVTAAPWYSQPYPRAQVHVNQQFVPANASWQTSSSGNASYPSGTLLPFLNNDPHHQFSASVSSGHGQHMYRTPPSNVEYVDWNHAVNWSGNPYEYQSTCAEKDVCLSKPSPPFSRMRKRVLSPKQPTKSSVNAILNDVPPNTCHPTSNPLRKDIDQSAYRTLPALVSNSSHAAKNKDADTNFLGGQVLKIENDVAIPVGRTDQPFQCEAAPNTKQELFIEEEQRPTTALVSRKNNDVSMPNAIVSNDVGEANESCAASTLKDEGDVPLGAKPREARLREEPSLRRRNAPRHTGDIFSTIPLKKSKYAAQNMTKTRKGRSAATKEKKERSSKVTKPAKTTTKRRQGRRRSESFSLLEHSGDEIDKEIEGKMLSQNDRMHARKKPETLRTHSDDEDFEDIGLRLKEKHSKVKGDGDDDNFSGIETTRPSRKKRKEGRGTTRKSSRLMERKRTTGLEPETNIVQKRKEVRKNERRVNVSTKSIDDLSDAEGVHSDSSGSDDDFVPASQREKSFVAMKARWEANKNAAEKQSSTPKKGPKRTSKKKTTKRKRSNAKGNTSDGENTDSGVDGQAFDSDSQNPSQRSSQPLDVKITSLPTRKRRRKVDYEDERKRLTEDEFTTIRKAFVAHYPPPPSNSQVQGRFEMRYGREMSQAMIQGLWENELKHWSERWWSLYTAFNNFVRAKKLEKPVDRKPTVTKKEVEGWAKIFYKEHGDAKVSPTGSKPDKSESSALTSLANHSKNHKDVQQGNKDSNAREEGPTTSPPKKGVNLPKLTQGNASAASDADPEGGHPSGTHPAMDFPAATTTKDANTKSQASSLNENIHSSTIAEQEGRHNVCDAGNKE